MNRGDMEIVRQSNPLLRQHNMYGTIRTGYLLLLTLRSGLRVVVPVVLGDVVEVGERLENDGDYDGWLVHCRWC